MAINQAVIDRTKGFEGEVPFMYLDTLGNVTVGVGHMLASSAAGQAIGFVLNSGGGNASSSQIGAEFANIKAMAPGLAMNKYQAASTMVLAPGVGDGLLSADLGNSQAQLRIAFARYDTFPEPAQEALLDMMFNMGAGKFTSAKWPSLFAACNAGDWMTAAAQSRRNGIQQSRNDAIAGLFRQATQTATTV